MSNITIERYSEKAIVVRGDTQSYKKVLTDHNGKWNPKLTGGQGWIFPMTKFNEVEELVMDIKAGTIKPEKYNNNLNYVKTSDFLSLLTRVERLEQLSNIKGINKEEQYFGNESREINENNVKRLLHSS